MRSKIDQPPLSLTPGFQPGEPYEHGHSRRFNGFTHSVIPACLLSLFILITSLLPAHSVLFYSTGDPAFNTNAPTGKLESSGWQYIGYWSTFSGTVISSNCFITAAHVGGNVGDEFTLQGTAYITVAAYPCPDADLRIFRVAGQFPAYAPLYTKRNERGKSLVVFGRGTQRGAEVRANNRLKGWLWGPGDSLLRWGQNKVSSIIDTGAARGDLLRATFNKGAVRTEAHLSAGDSGGAMFIKDGKTYKLAGINFGVDGPYNTTNSGTGFEAAMFDQRGFYLPTGDGNWAAVPKGMIPGGFYATRISSHTNWINSVLAQTSQ